MPAGVQRIGSFTETIVLDLARFSLMTAACLLATALCLRYNCWFSSVCIINHEIVFFFSPLTLDSLNFFEIILQSKRKEKKKRWDKFYWDRTEENLWFSSTDWQVLACLFTLFNFSCSHEQFFSDKTQCDFRRKSGKRNAKFLH